MISYLYRLTYLLYKLVDYRDSGTTVYIVIKIHTGSQNVGVTKA